MINFTHAKQENPYFISAHIQHALGSDETADQTNIVKQNKSIPHNWEKGKGAVYFFTNA